MEKYKQITLNIVISLFLFGIPVISFTQVSDINHKKDEILVMLPSTQLVDIPHDAISNIRFYQRFPEFYFAGTDKKVIRQLRKSGINIVVVDERPWSSAYAIVSFVPHKQSTKRFVVPNVISLYKMGDFEIIKGDAENFHFLQQQGFFCVPIEPKEIPVRQFSVYLPEKINYTTNDSIISKIISNVSDSTIRACIQGLQDFGTRYCLNSNRESVFNWLKDKFIQTGTADVQFDSFQYSNTWQKNVVATIPGNINSSFEIIVGGHFDSYSSNLAQAPGADDNASGTAAAIEMARVLRLTDYQPSVTLRFIGFAAEEVGLKGSAHYAYNARQQQRKIKVMFNYDMIGYRNQSERDRHFKLYRYPGSEAFANLYGELALRYTTLKPVLINQAAANTDSWPFYQQGFNTLFCHEYTFSPYYHSPNDLIQYLDIRYINDIVKAGLAALITLDQLPPVVENVQIFDRGNGNSLYIKWDSMATTDVNRFKVYVGTSSGIYDTSYISFKHSYDLTELITQKKYYVGISCIDLIGQEGLIVEQSGVPRLIPLSPIGLTVQSIENGLQLRWRKNLELDLHGYNIYRSVAPSTDFIRVNNKVCIDTTWIDTLFNQGTYSYFITAVDSSGYESTTSDTLSGSPTVEVASTNTNKPKEFVLYQNFPNPFNPTTLIQFDLPEESYVVLKLYNILGKEISTLVDRKLEPGKHDILFHAVDKNGTNLPSGVYFYRVYCSSMQPNGRNFNETKKFLIID